MWSIDTVQFVEVGERPFYSRTRGMGADRSNVEPSAINLGGGDVVSGDRDQSIVDQAVLFLTAVLISLSLPAGLRSVEVI
jgi:hypothetical protein